MSKLKRLRKELEKAGVEAILISSCLNQRYISSFNYTDGYILVLRNKAYLLADFRYIEDAVKTVSPKDFEIIRPEYSQIKLIFDLLRENSLKSVLIEESALTVEDYSRLKASASDIDLVSGGSKILDSLRSVKAADELFAISKAQNITDAAFNHIINFIKYGMTEKEIALEIEFFMRKHGAEKTSFDTIAVSGSASSMPHGVPRNTAIEKGFLTMDFGCVYDGYCSDMTRTISIGKADDEMKKLYATVLSAQTEALSAAINGERNCFLLDRTARDVIDRAGYVGYFGHSLGHGVGMYIHEAPRLAPSVDRSAELTVGNVVTFEPGIYISGKYGCRIEDMVAITEKGIKNFTHSPKELIELY